MDKEKVYIVINKKASIEPDKDALVKDLGEVYSTKPDIKKNIENIRVKKRNVEEDWDYITAIEISEKVLSRYPDIDLDLLGEVEVLIEYKSRQKERPFFEFIKVFLVCIILFFGASIAIINFHADVDAKKAMEKLYFTFTGEKKSNPLIMNIPYSIGIGVGVLTFFTRIFSFSERRKKEPGPMEIELFLYDEDMEKHILNDIKKNEKS
ncbi:stage V sporulation protein AA [Tissierella praeacuta DSM 18095]|uniref:Stage V sporulation protein AA n=1 Tax=Tissierella praeacuta DSM 18095 TaxID=1123404 RepID=A0A1M4SXX1_9FIRM|nr:stage V sporulation protein AA [Tissierella praeacuta]TCU70742.1 stage V sporulation protein AA [Tissierella praeacuta]SHE36807.1 stage V sporulation protein AA [Tissierella praeacuta DSM 18095]SUP01857.1 Stage V sporulation protein AA [Tissierella praeacuta]